MSDGRFASAKYTYVTGGEPTYRLLLQEISEPRFLAAGIYGANWDFAYDGSDRITD